MKLLIFTILFNVLNYTGASEYFILDDYPAQRAFSYRKLKSTYNGPCINAYNLNQGTYLDIGFKNNILDLDTLINFIGSDTGQIYKHYDQEENNDLTFTSGLYSTIINSGTLQTLNNNVCSIWPINSAAFFSSLDIYSTFSVLKADAKALINYFLWNGSFSNPIGFYNEGSAVGTNGYGIYAGGAKNSGYSGLSQTIANYNFNGTSYDVLINDNQEVNLSSSLIQASHVGRSSNNLAINGPFQELILYNTSQEQNKAEILNNINSFYNVY